MNKLFYFLLFLVFLFSAPEVFSQENQIRNEKYKFKLDAPAGGVSGKTADTIVQFRGTEKEHGADALFFLKRIMSFDISPVEKLEAYMKDAANVERFNNDFIGSMKIDFPDIKSLGKEFSYFNERPVVQGTYSLTTSGGSKMNGRFMLMLVKEQSSVYVFSWTSRESAYEGWNMLAEKTIASLKTY